MGEKEGYKLQILDVLNNKDDNEEANILIQGDNANALMALKEHYSGKIDIIYIDPIYNDRKHKWYTNMITRPNEDKHVLWANFMAERLKIAEELMSNDSVLFISINDEEVYNLKNLCDKIFNKLKFTCNFIWNKGATSSNNNKKNINICTEYILCYSTKEFSFNLDYKDYKKHKCYHGENFAYEGKVDSRPSQLISMKSNKQYNIKVRLRDGEYLTVRGSKYPQETVNRYQEVGKVFVNSEKLAFTKSFAEEEKQGICYENLLLDMGTSKSGTKELEMLIGKNTQGFYPKPVDLIKRLLQMSVKPNSIVLDYFAGSGTTAQAVLELNNENNHKIRFILCTNNENNIFSKFCFPRIKKLIFNGYNETVLICDIIKNSSE